MKKILLLSIIICTGISAFSQTNVEYFQDFEMNKKVNQSKANFKQVTTFNPKDSVINVQNFDIKNECLTNQLSFATKSYLPVGVWEEYDKDCNLLVRKDYGELVYQESALKPGYKKYYQLKNENAQGSTEENQEEILTTVDKAAEFPGGRDAMVKFISKNVQYPDVARYLGISGTSVVKFVVNLDGTIEQSVIVRSLEPSCDYEVIYLLKKMPKWKPGIKDGKEVRSYFVLPVKFALN